MVKLIKIIDSIKNEIIEKTNEEVKKLFRLWTFIDLDKVISMTKLVNDYDITYFKVQYLDLKEELIIFIESENALYKKNYLILDTNKPFFLWR